MNTTLPSLLFTKILAGCAVRDNCCSRNMEEIPDIAPQFEQNNIHPLEEPRDDDVFPNVAATYRQFNLGVIEFFCKQRGIRAVGKNRVRLFVQPMGVVANAFEIDLVDQTLTVYPGTHGKTETPNQKLVGIVANAPNPQPRSPKGNMKRAITTVIMLLVGMMYAQADDPENKHLLGTWKAIEPAEQTDDMLGRVKWESITFSANRVVEWSWIRDGKQEKHAGRYEILPDKGEPIYSRPRYDIHIQPATMAVRRPIIIRDHVVCLDNRFPQSWHVLKWGIVINQVSHFCGKNTLRNRINSGRTKR